MSEPKLLNFHGDDVIPASPEDALFHVIPAPYEYSVSYGSGTVNGPGEILKSSSQLELFTGWNVPADYGIYTAPPADCSGSPEEVLSRIARVANTTLGIRKIPVLLGGEHTVTCGAVRALQEKFSDFGVIQFDAHADLRDSFEGSRYSHACVMRRIHEQGIPIYQLGTRSYSLEEHRYRLDHNIAYRDAEDIWKNGHDLQLPEDFPEKVYITFDIDGLDASVIPATGTPVPGGLNWYQTMRLLKEIFSSRICIGFDLVEYAPIPGFHAYSFAAAQLVYNMMGYLVESNISKSYHLHARI